MSRERKRQQRSSHAAERVLLGAAQCADERQLSRLARAMHQGWSTINAATGLEPTAGAGGTLEGGTPKGGTPAQATMGVGPMAAVAEAPGEALCAALRELASS